MRTYSTTSTYRRDAASRAAEGYRVSYFECRGVFDEVGRPAFRVAYVRDGGKPEIPLPRLKDGYWRV